MQNVAQATDRGILERRATENGVDFAERLATTVGVSSRGQRGALSAPKYFSFR